MRILIDFDCTIADSLSAIVQAINKEFGIDIKVDYSCQWDFQGCIPSKYRDRALQLFNEQIFYDNLEFINNAKDVMERLNEKHEIIIVTKHDAGGIPLKDKWIKKNLPFVHRVVYLNQNSYDKSMINGDIIIDDKVECLLGGNLEDRKVRILFGDYGWNQKIINTQGLPILRFDDWLAIEKLIDLM